MCASNSRVIRTVMELITRVCLPRKIEFTDINSPGIFVHEAGVRLRLY